MLTRDSAFAILYVISRKDRMLNSRKFTDEEKQEAWDNYRDNPDDPGAYTHLLEVYVPLVEILAAKAKGNLPSQVEVGDLVNEAFFGLVDAVEKFDESKGFKFETYASARIRGSIQDSLRDSDWVSRYARLKFKLVSGTEAALLEELQRYPTQEEVAERAGISMEEYVKITSAYQNSFPFNIDEYMSDATHEFFSLSELLSDESAPDVSYGLEFEELSKVLEQAMLTLDEQQSIVVFLHVYESLKFSEIAEIIGVSPQRITSIYDKALQKIRSEFRID